MESELLIRSPGFPLWVMKMPKALSFPLVPHSPCTLQDLPSLDAFLSLPGSAPTEAAFLGLPPGPTGNNHTPCSPALACRPCHSHALPSPRKGPSSENHLRKAHDSGLRPLQIHALRFYLAFQGSFILWPQPPLLPSQWSLQTFCFLLKSFPKCVSSVSEVALPSSAAEIIAVLSTAGGISSTSPVHLLPLQKVPVYFVFCVSRTLNQSQPPPAPLVFHDIDLLKRPGQVLCGVIHFAL